MPKGLYLRNGIYWARFKIKGIEYRESLRTRSVSVAERRAKSIREAIEERVFFGAIEPVSWKSAVVSWNDKGAKALDIASSTFDRYVTSLGQLDGYLSDKMLREIDHKLLKTIVADRQKQGATNATIRRDLTALSSVLAHAVDLEWIDENPAKTIDRSRFKERRAIIILPRPDSIDQMFSDESRFMDLARFALETGMRQEEIASLTYDQIDLTRMVATLEMTKGRRVRAVTLTPAAKAIIVKQPRHIKHRFVFWEDDGERFTYVFERWRNKVAGAAQRAARAERAFTRFRFHDLRHLFAINYLREQRGSLYDLQLELGHSSIQTTERYLDHLTATEQHAVMQRVAQNPTRMQRFER